MKKLNLKKEVLNELSTEELTGVVGGESQYCQTVPVNYCLSIRQCVITEGLKCQVPTLSPTCPC